MSRVAQERKQRLLQLMRAEHLSAEEAGKRLGIPRATAFRYAQGESFDFERGRWAEKPEPVLLPSTNHQPEHDPGPGAHQPQPVILRTPGVDPYAELFKDME
jgi:hypothetical protein